MSADRQTRPTTRMLLAACIAVSEGKDILLIGHTADYAEQLAVKLWDLIAYLDIPIDAEQKIMYQSAQNLTPRAMEVFIDHYVGETS